MKKYLISILAVLLIVGQPVALTFAKSKSSAMSVAIKKYKKGNYTGCLQDCQVIVKHNPKSQLAYYYMAMSYVQAGKKKEAIKNYGKVLSLGASSTLKVNAETGKRCLETPDKCVLETGAAVESTELDRFIASPRTLAPNVKNDFRQKRLDSIRNQINQGQEMDDYSFRKINYNDNKNSLIAQAQPTDAEIKAALKVLSDAGVNPSTYNQTQQVQNPEMMQLQAMLGTKSSSENDMLMNMMAQQGKDGRYSPQMMQAAIMNSMMKSYSLNLGSENN